MSPNPLNQPFPCLCRRVSLDLLSRHVHRRPRLDDRILLSFFGLNFVIGRRDERRRRGVRVDFGKMANVPDSDMLVVSGGADEPGMSGWKNDEEEEREIHVSEGEGVRMEVGRKEGRN